MNYDAFISYAQFDAKEHSKVIQQNLHHVGKPWYYLGRYRKVFHDTTDLEATDSLPEKLINKMSESRYLILVASPASPNSNGVNLELTWWLSNRKISEIIIVVVAGQIEYLKNDFDWTRTNVLPKVLKGHFSKYPLWIDLREYTREKSYEKKEAFLIELTKVIARLDNRDPVDVYSREKRRKVGIITTIVLTSAIVLTLSALLLQFINVSLNLNDKVSIQTFKSQILSYTNSLVTDRILKFETINDSLNKRMDSANAKLQSTLDELDFKNEEISARNEEFEDQLQKYGSLWAQAYPSVNIPKLDTNESATIGKVYFEGSLKPVKKCELILLENGVKVQTTNTDEYGIYFMKFPRNASYSLTAKLKIGESEFSESLYLSAENNASTVQLKDIKLKSKRNIISLSEIQFNPDFPYSLLPESYSNLYEITSIIENNPDLQAEIHVHSKCGIDKNADMELSVRRCSDFVKYFKSFGFQDRISCVAKGSSEPLNECCNSPCDEIKNHENERVEFVVTQN